MSDTEERPALPEAMREYFAAMGRKGGAAKGDAKRRGDAQYYSSLAKRRKAKKEDEPCQ